MQKIKTCPQFNVLLLILIMASLNSGCQEITEPNPEVHVCKSEPDEGDKIDADYSEFLNSINIASLSKDERQNRFFHFMLEDIPSFWNGTPWDFNGTTRIPKEGHIACGYFVTNVLSDFGFDIARVKLAQQASSKMITKLCNTKSIKRYSDINKMKDYILSRSPQEVYIVGLDFHTGFIIRDENKIYFLHSNYIHSQGVMLEEVDASIALNASNTYMIGSISDNEKLFE